MASTDARPVPLKNTAYRHYFCIRKNDGTLITAWTGADSEISQDGGTMADATNEATEIATNSGCGYIDLTAAEMNNDNVVLKVTVTNTDAIPYVVTLFPEEAGDIRVNVSEWNDVALATTNPLPNAAADAAGGLVISDAGGLDIDTMNGTVNTISANVTTVDTVVDAIKVVTDALPNSGALTDISTNVSAILTDTGTDGVLLAGTATSAQLVDDVWDEVLSGATHNVTNSAGRRLRNLQELGGAYGGFVWIDTTNGTAGTVGYENGTSDNPVDSIADANTIAAAIGLSRFQVAPNGSITLAATQANQFFLGSEFTLALGGQTISGSTFTHASVSGISAGTDSHWFDCTIGNATIGPSDYHNCDFTGTLTLLSAGDYNLVRCQSGVAGASSPTIDMGAAVGATTLELRDWRGGITLNNLAAGDVVTLDGIFGTITLNGADASVEIRGIYKALTNNLTGSPTVTETGIEGDITTELATVDTNVDSLVTSVGTMTDLGGGADIANNLADMAGATFSTTTDSLEAIRDRGDSAWVTGAGGSDRLLMVDTTIATLATQVSFTLTAGSTDDDAYNGCTIVIEDAATSTQKAVGIVDDYTGSTKTVTLLEDPGVFTMAATDKVYVLAEKSLKPTTAADYHIDVTSGGAVGIDWANVENPTTAVDLSGTDIQLCDTVTTNTDMRGTDNALLAASAPANFGDLAITASTGYITVGGYLGGVLTETTGGRIAGNFDTFFENADAATANTVDDVGGSGASAADVADAVWDELQSAHTTAGSFGEIATEIAAILVDTGTTLPATLTTIEGKVDTVDTNVDAVLVDTNELQTDWADGGRLDLILDTAASGGDATAANQTTIINAIGTMTDLGGGSDIANNLADIAGSTFATGTDSLEAIRNRGDAAWASAGSALVIQNTTIATLASQTSFTLTAGSSDDDAYNGLAIVITDSVTSEQKALGVIEDYDGATKTVTLRTDPGIFTMAVGDTVDIIACITSALSASSGVEGWLG